MTKLFLYILFLLSLNTHAMFTDSDLPKLVKKIGVSKASSCNKIDEGIFLGSYHGAYPKGCSFSNNLLIKDNVTQQDCVYKDWAAMIDYIGGKYQSCLLVHDDDTIKHYVIEHCNDYYHAMQVEAIININAKEDSDEADHLRDGAILIITKDTKMLFPSSVKFWQISPIVLGKMGNLIIKGILPILNGSDLQGFEELKITLKEVFFMIDNHNQYLILNNINISVGMSGSIVCDRAGTIVGVVLGSGKIQQKYLKGSKNIINCLMKASKEFGFQFTLEDAENNYTVAFANAVFIKLISQEEFTNAESKALKINI